MLVRLALAGLALAVTGGPALAQTLHLISVADSEDGAVGPAFARNAARINDKMRSISGLANLHFNLVFIDGIKRKYSCAEIAKAIKDVRVDPDDVVVFYHSGHGQSSRRSARDTNFSRFPALQCSESAREKLPRLEDISNDLRKKKARVTQRMRQREPASSTNEIAAGDHSGIMPEVLLLPPPPIHFRAPATPPPPDPRLPSTPAGRLGCRVPSAGSSTSRCE